MSNKANKANKPDAATLALWQAAETGEIDDIKAVLSRVVDVNARNEHGVTALMRAAQHGHRNVVRLLLANGADANVIRNDKFTALSLAAFFGHTDVVRILMEHGADSQTSTRHGTSAHMWATARTFNEVVDQLKQPAPPKTEKRATVSRPTPAPTMAPARPVAKTTGVPQVVHTLKDPPEIWELVHEAPKGFNARATFVTRLRTMRLTFRLAAAAGLLGACILGALVLRGVHARSETITVQPLTPSSPAVKVQNDKTTFESSVPPTVTAPAATTTISAVPNVAPTVPASPQDIKTAPARRRNSHYRGINLPAVEMNTTEQPAATATVQKIAAPPESSDAKVRANPTTQTKSSSPLSPQLITPAQNTAPKKKVIQWP